MFVSNPANTFEPIFIVKFNVTILSQPFDAVNVWLYVPVLLYVVPYQTKLSHATAVVSPIAVGFIVML